MLQSLKCLPCGINLESAQDAAVATTQQEELIEEFQKVALTCTIHSEGIHQTPKATSKEMMIAGSRRGYMGSPQSLASF